MIDIETTGVNKEKDEILEVALVEIEMIKGYWKETGKTFHRVLHYSGEPTDSFAREHMSELYKRCNETEEIYNYEELSKELKLFLHGADVIGDVAPKMFMGWNASNFDLPFMFEKGILEPSYYVDTEEGQTMLGDVHYRIYEQTGALNYVINTTGLDKNTVKLLANDLNPVKIDLPLGKSHDALYDCYDQINMMNGLIAVGRKK